MTEQVNKVPSLRFPEFDGKWEGKLLKDAGTFFSGGTPSTTNRSLYEGDIPFIKSGEINALETEQYLSQEGVNASSAKLVEKGDLLYALYGATSGEVGVSKLRGAINQAVLCIRSKQNTVYLYNYLRLKKGHILSKYLQGGQGNLSADIIKKLVVHFPNLQEQQKIADFLTAVDKRIEQLEEKKRLLTEYKKGVMQQIFSQHIRFKDDHANPYPDWQEKRLGDVASFFSGGTPITTNKILYDGDIPFIKSGEINALKTEQYLSEAGVSGSSAKLVEIGDLLYALYGATSGEVGISKIKGAINQAVLCIRSQQNISYLYNFLRFNKVHILNKYLQGGQGNLSADIIKKLIVPLPSIQEQQKIADFLTSVDNKIEQVALQLEQAKTFKKGLLQQMFV